MNKKQMTQVAIIAVTVLAGTFAMLAGENSYYVSSTGNDANACTQAAPCRTIMRAIGIAQTGDTINVGDGIYNEYVYVDKSIILMANGAVIDGTGATGTVRDGLVYVSASNVVMDGFVIRDAPNFGLANFGNESVFRNNFIHDTRGAGIWMRNGKNNLFEDNEVYNAVLDNKPGDACNPDSTAWASAINSGGAAGQNTWRGNYMHDNCGEGIVAYAGDVVDGNTFENNWSSEIYIVAGNVTVSNNIIRNDKPYIPRGDGGEWRAIPAGIAIGDEEMCLAKDGVIANNIISGVRYGISFFKYIQCSGLVNFNIEGNTITARDYALRILDGAHANSFVHNNIILSPVLIQGSGITLDNLAPLVVDTTAEITGAFANTQLGGSIVIRGGQYDAPRTGWQFARGDVTLINYPGEQVTLRQPAMNISGNYTIKCLQTSPAVDNNRIIGSDVGGQKGIVFLGVTGAIAPAIVGYQCDNWEIAGAEFRGVGYALFQRKVNNGNTSADGWHVHDNLVSDFYRESGMQFNGNGNLIENNEIVKLTSQYTSTFGCQLLNLLGNNNVVRGNTLTRVDQSVRCIGIFFEWNLADNNLIEDNTITGVVNGVSFFGGDNNVIRNNVLSGTDTGFVLRSWAGGLTSVYPCNFSSFMPLESDTNNPDWGYMYPYDCFSRGNVFSGNVLSGFTRTYFEQIAGGGNVFEGTITPIPSTLTPTVASPTVTFTVTAIPPSITASRTATPTVSQTPTVTATMTATPTYTATATPSPTATETPLPSACTIIFEDAGYRIYACKK